MRGGEIDPEIAAARARQALIHPPFDVASLPPADTRERSDRASLFFVDGGPALPRVENFSIPGPTQPLRARLYRPHLGRSGAILHLHGGGFGVCNIDVHDRLLRSLALASGLAVLGVDYRLAPEHPYPAGLDDSIATWRWLIEQAADLGLDETQLLVAGDSAGANLALALCVAERDAGRRLPFGAALFYGCYAPDLDTDSQLRLGGGAYGLTTERMRWYWTQYVGGDFERAPPGAAPLRASLHGLPPLYLNLAELDPLADDTRMLAERLAAAKIAFELDCWAAAPHGFLQLTRDAALARRAMAAAGAWLRRRAA